MPLRIIRSEPLALALPETAPHLRQRPGTLPGQRSETQAGRSLRQTRRPPIESPASFSAGSDELAMVPPSQSGKGAAEGGD